MHWLAAYTVIILALIGLLFRYAWHRPIPPKCFSCVNYNECDRSGECEQKCVRFSATAPHRSRSKRQRKISVIK